MKFLALIIFLAILLPGKVTRQEPIMEILQLKMKAICKDTKVKTDMWSQAVAIGRCVKVMQEVNKQLIIEIEQLEKNIQKLQKSLSED